jgi:hypothetical protein
MKHEQSVSKWLKDNANLSWTRSGGDTPAVKLDRLYINRKEAYEIRDFILEYYDTCNLEHKDENYKITLNKIFSYKAGEKVKRIDMLRHLAQRHNK